MHTFQILTEKFQQYASKPAIIYKEQVISFQELKDSVFALANGLESLGIGPNSRVGIFLPNIPQCAFTFLASFCRGACVVPLDFMLKTEELVTCLSHAQVDILFVIPKADVDLVAIKNAIPSLKKVIIVNGVVQESWQMPFEAVLKSGALTSVSYDSSRTALIMYTSGTTGAPKGIVLTYKHLDGPPQAMKHFVDLTDRDVKLCAIPLSHIGGFIYLQNCIIFGITLVLMDRFNPMEFLRLVQSYKVTCFHIVPPMYTALLTLKNIDQYDLSSLRWVVVFGAPSSPDILERFHKYCPNAKLLNGWGMTETCPPNTVTPLSNPKIESVGKPAPNCEIAIVDDNDKPLPVGEIGEIVIRGWVVMKEYFKDEKATAEAKRNGWFHTGDLGRFDQEGLLYIVGRKKEMIKVAGQIVYAPEVESVLYKHENILEAAVIGVADNIKGEAVKAFIVLKPESSINAQDIRSFAREHLANFKVPSIVEIVEQLPKNRTGKIDKEILKQSQVAGHKSQV